MCLDDVPTGPPRRPDVHGRVQAVYLWGALRMTAMLDRKKVVEWMDARMVEARSNYRDCEHNVGWADRYEGEIEVVADFMAALWGDCFEVEEGDSE